MSTAKIESPTFVINNTDDISKYNETKAIIAVVAPQITSLLSAVKSPTTSPVSPAVVKSSWKPKAKYSAKSSNSTIISISDINKSSESVDSFLTKISIINNNINDCEEVIQSDGSVATNTMSTIDSNRNNSTLTISGSLMNNTDHIDAEFLSQSCSFTEAFQQVKAYFSTAAILPPNMSTISVPKASSDLLYLLDTISQNIVNIILQHQQEQLSESSPVIFKEYNRSLLLYRIVSVQELTRHRRQFVKANASGNSMQSSLSSSTLATIEPVPSDGLFIIDDVMQDKNNIGIITNNTSTLPQEAHQRLSVQIGILFIDYLSSQL